MLISDGDSDKRQGKRRGGHAEVAQAAVDAFRSADFAGVKPFADETDSDDKTRPYAAPLKVIIIEHDMENTAGLDWILGALAIAILAGALLMLFSGVLAMNKK